MAGHTRTFAVIRIASIVVSIALVALMGKWGYAIGIPILLGALTVGYWWPGAVVPRKDDLEAKVPATPPSSGQMVERVDDAGNLAGFSGLGTVLAEQERIDEAIEAFRAGAAAGSEDSSYNLGTLLLKQGRHIEAEAPLRQAVESGHALAAFNLGILLEDQGRVDEAISAYRLAITRGDKDAYAPLGRILLQQERFLDAAKVYGEAIQAGESMHYERGCSLWVHGDYVEAEAEYRAAIGLGDGRAHKQLGILLDELGRPEEAAAAFRNAVAAGDTGAVDEVREVDRKLADQRATGAEPSGYAVATPWKVALLRQMGEPALADAMERRLAEQISERG